MTNPNESAFETGTFTDPDKRGLTKREWFAGLAMQGLACSHTFGAENEAYILCAVTLADLLIAELNKELK